MQIKQKGLNKLELNSKYIYCKYYIIKKYG